jgi:hypothetical protein
MNAVAAQRLLRERRRRQLAASEARTRTKEAQLNKIAGLLGAIDTPAEHETALRAILRVVMDEN